MSEQNVGLHRRWFEAYNARDIEALIAYCDPGIEFHSVFAAVGGALYHGHDGMRRWHRDIQDVWGEEISIEPEAYFDLGGSVPNGCFLARLSDLAFRQVRHRKAEPPVF